MSSRSKISLKKSAARRSLPGGFVVSTRRYACKRPTASLPAASRSGGPAAAAVPRPAAATNMVAASMLRSLMAASYRGRRRAPLASWIACALPFSDLLPPGDPPADQVFVGFVTDTECGPNHAPMRAKGDMGANDKECTLKRVARGATFGFVDVERKHFFQLDDQQLPRPFAGEKVRITGRIEGDSILVT